MSWGTFVWAYTVPLEYQTTYYSGVGPYYSSAIFTAIDDTMHYEEYGFNFDFYATASIGMYFGDTASDSDYYYLSANAEADVLSVTPYKQVVWFQRPLANLETNGSPNPHAWIGGAYDVEIGDAYVYYEENAYTGVGDLWSGGAWVK